ncbi:MAG: hypothetical protein AAF694_03745 [Bacteroidota bacterium]
MSRTLSDLSYRARQKGRSAGQYAPDRTINVRKVVELIVASCAGSRHPGVKGEARPLLEQMADNPWQITAGPHKGGLGGGGRNPDKTMHITLRVNHRSYHLRMDNRGHLFQMTGGNAPSIAPWLAPGAAVE